MAGLVAARPDLRLVRRVITRAPELGGEDYVAVTPEVFEQAAQDGAFCLHWSAHGLRYGIPGQVRRDVAEGCECVANLSRGALTQAAAVFPGLFVLDITAAPETLARRLADRGRETAAEIATRLAQATKPLPAGLDVATIANDGTLEEAVSLSLAALQPARA